MVCPSFQVNHLSQFLLTNRLLPLLTNAGQNKINNFTPRVVTVGSNAASIGKIDYSYVQNSDKLPFLFTRYANSKLMNAMFIKKLSEILKDNGVVAHVVHPGFVASGRFNAHPHADAHKT
jgi:NAD(P)-dependent dehydrogenase (short-subunit alcohol dehydrogenase family)